MSRTQRHEPTKKPKPRQIKRERQREAMAPPLVYPDPEPDIRYKTAG